MRRRPELARLDISEIAERAPAVAGGVLVPARDGQVPPAAVPAAGCRDGNVIPAVGEQVDLWRRRFGGLVDSVVPTRLGRRTAGGRHLGRMRVDAGRLRHPLLE